MRWTVHGRRELYESEWVNLWLEDVELPDGQRLQHHVLRMPRRSVTVVVLDEDGERVLLLWRHRFITDTWGWEVPAGWTEGDEALEETARREVEEETGWTPLSLTQLTTYYALPGLADLHFTMFRADGARYLGAPSDGSEASRVEWVPIANLQKLVDEGHITDGPSLMALSFTLAFVAPRDQEQ
jgi:8-oxo-dGTP pyrophosphatase MutT (NUDIX family)